jgi:hypothetical protein
VDYRPPREDVEAVFDVLVERSDYEGQFFLSLSVPWNLGLAEKATRAAATAGVISAHNNLGLILSRQGRAGEAEVELRTAVAAGVPAASNNLATLLGGC